MNTVAEPSGVHAEAGFAGNVLLVTLGCAKNLVDSEVMLGVLDQRGFRPITDAAQADLIVVNTCAFLQSAVEEGIDRILELSQYKEQGRCRRLVVAGCMVERYRAKLEESLPEVDQFLSTDELLKIGEVDSTSEDCFEGARRPYFIYDESMPRIRSTSGHSAFVKIAEGCDRPCSFCIIPKIRGAFRSRSRSSVVAEVEELLKDDVQEITFVAQDLTAYGTDLSQKPGIQKPQLVDLLEDIHQKTRTLPPYWLRLLYAYPIGVDERLVRTIVELPNVCNYLDLPLQHISNDVLKRMHRPLGERGTRGLIEQIRNSAPELSLRTTFVVGFPGESEEDVDRLEQFIREGHFTHVGVFTYSQEAEAKSYTHPNQVAEELKQQRRARLMEAQAEIVARRLDDFCGTEVRVLLEGAHSESDLLLVGRTEWQGPETDGEVIVNELSENIWDGEGDFDSAKMQGRFAKVRITEVAGYDLVGTLEELF